jgi:tetratricopeptide (TPR) repeat protein
MNTMKTPQICSKIIEVSFHALFFLVPLILTPVNYELFEFNKMMLVYSLTVIIVASWLIKMVSSRRFCFGRTPLDLPLSLFLISQVLSTIFSLDRHTSIFGYYSRFHGGLLSTLSYFLLYYALVSNVTSNNGGNQEPETGSQEKVTLYSLLRTALLSGFLVAIYGILEHPNPFFRNPDGSWRGIDTAFWAQDVQLRVFSTIGQPNWLAAYLSMLVPVAMAFMLYEKRIYPKIYYLLATICYYWCILFTNSRSGAAGFLIALVIFLSLFLARYLTFRRGKRPPKAQKKERPTIFARQNLFFLSLLLLIFIILTRISGLFLLGRFVEVFKLKNSPASVLGNSSFGAVPGTVWHLAVLPPLSRGDGSPDSDRGFRLAAGELNPEKSQKSLTMPLEERLPSPPISSPLPTKPAPVIVPPAETKKIRDIVWKGAIEIFKQYPIFGSGVETFAYSYYQFRPQEHNLTTEWDFLYNKAHNEYLNFLATTGILGFTTYMFLISAFVYWCLKKLLSIRYPLGPIPYTLISALFASYIAYLVQNFFSFSVVPIATFFFLFPAIAFVLAGKLSVFSCPPAWSREAGRAGQLSVFTQPVVRRLLTAIVLVVSFYCLTTLLRFWLADVAFAKAYNLAKAGYFQGSYVFAKEAITQNPNEPMYYDQLAYNAAVLATRSNEATASAYLSFEALGASNQTLRTSPFNVNFWKTAVKVFYELGSLNEDYFKKALEAIEMTMELSPTDPKLPLNAGLIYLTIDKSNEAAESFKKSIELKPDFRDPHFALGVLYHKQAVEDDKIVDRKLFNQAVSQMEYILANIDSGDVEAQEKLREWKTQ